MTKGTLLSLDETQAAMEVLEVLKFDNLATGWKKKTSCFGRVIPQVN